jgi:hypothetical protein
LTDASNFGCARTPSLTDLDMGKISRNLDAIRGTTIFLLEEAV